MQAVTTLRLKKNQEKRLQAGHVWIYSNEIDVAHTPISDIEPGALVNIVTHTDKLIGLAYCNPHTLLCARLLTSNSDEPIDYHFIIKRLELALTLRNNYLSNPFYRLIYGESDGLPGLVVDRYGDFLVAQINTAGMERLKTDILLALQTVLQPQGILWRNDSPTRTVEGLPTYVEVAAGEIPETIELHEHGARFLVSLVSGQKTGWFYDHRDNRALVQKYAPNKRVLDLFSYTGSFAIQAAVANAREVVAVDSSAPAMDLLHRNAELNSIAHKVKTYLGDVTQTLQALYAAGEQFDIVLLDPPAFIKRRKDIKPGQKGYQKLNRLAMSLVAQGGLLVSSSCSLHCTRDMLSDIILHSAQQLNRRVKIIGQGHQALDHPLHPAIPETNYLKSFFCVVE